MEYIISGTRIKENIIVKEYSQNFSVSFRYTTKNLFLRFDELGNVFFVNEDEETIFSFADFFMIDAEGNISTDVQITVQETKTSEYVISVTPDDGWAQTARYPVTIDPTITIGLYSGTIRDTYVYQATPDAHFYSSPFVRVSGTSTIYMFMGLMNFDLPSVLQNKKITYAHLSLNSYSTKTQGRIIGLYENNSVFV